MSDSRYGSTRVLGALADKLPNVAEHLEAPCRRARGARSARSIFTGEALVGRRVPERPRGGAAWSLPMRAVRRLGRRPRTAAQRPPAGRRLKKTRRESSHNERVFTTNLTSTDTTEWNASELLHSRPARASLVG